MTRAWFQFSDNKVLYFTLVLVLFMAVPTFLSVIDETQNVPSESFMPVLTESASRIPSSIPSDNFAQGLISDRQNLSLVFDFLCGKSEQRKVRLQGDFIQLLGEPCIKSFNARKMEITNRRNGYTASIFALQNSKYQTDLIQLEPGLNEIIIRYSNEMGEVSEEVLHSYRE